MVSSTTNSPAVSRKSSGSLRIQAVTLPKGSLSPTVTRKQKKVERRHTVSLSGRNSIFKDMRLFARSLSRGSNEEVDELAGSGGPGDCLLCAPNPAIISFSLRCGTRYNLFSTFRILLSYTIDNLMYACRLYSISREVNRFLFDIHLERSILNYFFGLISSRLLA